MAMFTINCRGKIIVTEPALVMGIINATPDSFYEGHASFSEKDLLALAQKMVEDGATIIDIGGQSTRPGSERVQAAEEIQRLIPVIQLIRSHFPGIIISADTYHSKVAVSAVEAGADMINDISAGEMDKAMISTVAQLGVPYICMHMKGTPADMQLHPVYDDVVKEVLDFFTWKIKECTDAGIKDIIIDPGFGFGKTIAHNFELLRNLHVFRILDKPILAGLSRKSTVYKTLHTTAAHALNGTTVLHTIAIQNGANLLRVHDVKEAVEVITLMEHIV